MRRRTILYIVALIILVVLVLLTAKSTALGTVTGKNLPAGHFQIVSPAAQEIQQNGGANLLPKSRITNI